MNNPKVSVIMASFCYLERPNMQKKLIRAVNSFLKQKTYKVGGVSW